MAELQQRNAPQYNPGDIVLTKYGVVVITDIICQKKEQDDAVANEPSQFKGRMWRVPEMSIASSGNCTLQFSTVSFNFYSQ